MGNAWTSLCDVSEDALELKHVSAAVQRPAMDTEEEEAPLETARLESIVAPEARSSPGGIQTPKSPKEVEGVRETTTSMSQLTRKRVGTFRGSVASSVNPEGIRISGRRQSTEILKNLGMDLRQRGRGSVATMEGDIYSDFIFEAELGKGGFGTVYKTRQKKDGKSRAIKAISVDLTNPVVFQRELDQARKLKHPNIVRLLSHYRDENHFYLVMELYEGGDLLSEVTKYPFVRKEVSFSVGLPDEVLASYAWQMCSGLAYLHYHYIVHRDIKCENYMKVSDADESPLKLIDLGIAGNLQHTQSGFLTDVVGTISTMAPEVFKKKYTEQCDLWSLGITLYICSICQEPWVAPCHTRYLNEREIAHKLQDNSSEMSYSDRRWQYRSAKNVNLVKSLLVRDPAQRPRARDLLAQDPYVKSGRPRRGCC